MTTDAMELVKLLEHGAIVLETVMGQEVIFDSTNLPTTLREAAATIDRQQMSLLSIAHMDCLEREGEEPAHLLMMRLAKDAITDLALDPYTAAFNAGIEECAQKIAALPGMHWTEAAKMLRGLKRERAVADWIEWNGGEECPRSLMPRIEVKYRDGTFDFGKADEFHWPHDIGQNDIIAYRLTHTEQEK